MTKHDPHKPLVLFVCTGNVCRSPMAEYLLRHQLGHDSRWQVASAGMMAHAGMPASHDAIRALRSRHISASRHRSRPISREWVDAADLVVVMTRAHRDQYQVLFPDAVDKVYLLRTFDPDALDRDVEDPIGASFGVYVKTLEMIESALPGLIAYMQTFKDKDEKGT